MLRTLLIETVVYGVTWKYECLSVCVIVYCRYQAESGSRLNEKEIADWLAVRSVCWRIGWGNSFMHVPNCHLSVLLSTEMEWVLYIYFITVHILLLPPHYKWSCYISVIIVPCRMHCLITWPAPIDIVEWSLCVCWLWLWILQKRMNGSRCRLECELVVFQGSMS